MKPSRPRYRMFDRLAGKKRRRKDVECTAGLSSETNGGFFLFRKRNPLEHHASTNGTAPTASPEPEKQAAPTADENLKRAVPD